MVEQEDIDHLAQVIHARIMALAEAESPRSEYIARCRASGMGEEDALEMWRWSEQQRARTERDAR